MMRLSRTRGRLATVVLAAVLSLTTVTAFAQSTPAAPAPATTPAPTAPATPTPAPAPGAAPAAPVAQPPGTGAAAPAPQPPDTSISQTLDLPSRPAVTLSGKATWDDGFKSITAAFAKLNDAIVKGSVTGAGHPLAVFTETDDAGFSFTAEIPLDKAPDAGTLPADIKVGETPGGKAMRFQHRGSYDEIDSTYEAITAYLDEKGLESRNLFAEEYLKSVKTQDDQGLEIDIYVFLK